MRSARQMPSLWFSGMRSVLRVLKTTEQAELVHGEPNASPGRKGQDGDDGQLGYAVSVAAFVWHSTFLPHEGCSILKKLLRCWLNRRAFLNRHLAPSPPDRFEPLDRSLA